MSHAKNISKIANITQHMASPEQQKEGVVNGCDSLRQWVAEKLTFSATYTAEDMNLAAKELAEWAAENYQAAMIGGMPSFMPVLQQALLTAGVDVYYARSERVSQDQRQPDGSVRKIAIFKHLGFFKVLASRQ